MKYAVGMVLVLGLWGCHSSQSHVRSDATAEQTQAPERGLAVWVAHPESLGQALVMLDGDKASTPRALFLTEEAVRALAPTSEWHPVLATLAERNIAIYVCEQALDTFGLTQVSEIMALHIMPDVEQSEAYFRRAGWFFISFP